MAMDCRTCREPPAGVVGRGLLTTRTYPHPDAHPNPFTPPHADAQPRSQPYANTHSHAHSHAYAHRCPNADSHRHPSAHARDRGGREYQTLCPRLLVRSTGGLRRAGEL